jgi:arylsulfatase A-like enzyme
VHVADWFPTLAALTGYTPATDLAWDGLDRWDAIRGLPGAAARAKPVCIVHSTGRAVIGDRWKLIARTKGSPQLYDLIADPFETTDRAAEEPEVVASYAAIAAADAALDLPDLPADLRDAAL